MFNNQMGFNNGMQTGQAALPFRYDMTTSLPVTGAPDNPSTYPSFNVIPQMQQYYRTVVGFCIHEVQNNVNKNHLRVFAFNAMSSNNWNNQFFGSMVIFAAEYACFLHMTQRMDIRNAIARAAMESANWITALLACQFMQQGLPVDGTMGPELQNLLREYETMTNTLSQFKQQLQWNAQQQQQQSQFQMQQPNNWMGNHQPQQSSVPVGGAVFSGSGMFTGNAAPVAPANSDIGNLGVFSSSGEVRDEIRRNKQRDNLEEIHFAPNNTPQMVAKVEQPTTVSQKETNVPLKYGHLYSLRHCKSVVRNWTPDRAHAIVFNPKTHAMFLELDHTGARGIEVIKTLEEVGMEYLDHELDSDLQMKTFTNQFTPRRNIDVNWDNVKNAKRTIDIDKGMEGDISIPFNGVINTEKVVACSYEQATQITKMRINDKKIRLSENAPLVYIYRNLTPFFVDERDQEEVNNLKIAIVNVDDYIEALAILELYSKKIPFDIWNFINNRLTKAVNKELKVGMGLSTQIDNFFEDFKDLNSVIAKKGEGVANAFYSTQKNTIYNIFRTLKGEDLKKYITTIGGNIEEGFDVKHIVFLEDYLTVQVPWLSSKLDVMMRENAGAVMESFVPEFYSACKYIVEKAKEMHLSQQMIVTNDGVKISIDVPIIGKDIFIVSRIN